MSDPHATTRAAVGQGPVRQPRRAAAGCRNKATCAAERYLDGVAHALAWCLALQQASSKNLLLICCKP